MDSQSNPKPSFDGQKMRELADCLTAQIPGYGFALMVYDFDNGDSVGNYVSNVNDEFMIKALECQLDALKKNKTFLTP